MRSFGTPGADAAERWLRAIGLTPVPHWHAEIAIFADGDSRFDLNVYAEEWGYFLQHAGRTSWIRTTDVAFVHGRDEFGLLVKTPDLLGINAFIADLEVDHQLSFRRATASVRSNISGAAQVIRDWLLEPLPQLSVSKTRDF